jgi:hypothetical protein
MMASVMVQAQDMVGMAGEYVKHVNFADSILLD